MNSHELKMEKRKARLLAAADRADERSDAAYGKSDLSESASGIPLGQPILVGHHSEGRHRAAIKRADNAMRKSIEERDKAKNLRYRAEGVGTGGISSDDPDAIEKLKEAIEVSRSSANTRRLKARISQIENLRKRETKTTEFEGFTVVENIEDNRLQFLFEGKPSEEDRKILKTNGFRWAPSKSAWQRQLTNNAIWYGRTVIEKLNKTTTKE